MYGVGGSELLGCPYVTCWYCPVVALCARVYRRLYKCVCIGCPWFPFAGEEVAGAVGHNLKLFQGFQYRLAATVREVAHQILGMCTCAQPPRTV